MGRVSVLVFRSCLGWWADSYVGCTVQRVSGKSKKRHGDELRSSVGRCGQTMWAELAPG